MWSSGLFLQQVAWLYTGPIFSYVWNTFATNLCVTCVTVRFAVNTTRQLFHSSHCNSFQGLVLLDEIWWQHYSRHLSHSKDQQTVLFNICYLHETNTSARYHQSTRYMPHNIQKLTALLTRCERNPPTPMDSFHKGPVMRSFGVFCC